MSTTNAATVQHLLKSCIAKLERDLHDLNAQYEKDGESYEAANVLLEKAKLRTDFDPLRNAEIATLTLDLSSKETILHDLSLRIAKTNDEIAICRLAANTIERFASSLKQIADGIEEDPVMSEWRMAEIARKCLEVL